MTKIGPPDKPQWKREWEDRVPVMHGLDRYPSIRSFGRRFGLRWSEVSVMAKERMIVEGKILRFLYAEEKDYPSGSYMCDILMSVPDLRDWSKPATAVELARAEMEYSDDMD